MQVVALTNLKGGVGKTTTTVHLAAALAEQGKRILVVDADGQGHCAIYLGAERNSGLSQVLLRNKQGSEAGREYAPVREFIVRDVRPGVDLIPCDPSIAHAESRISNEAMRELRLQRRLKEVENEYDLVLIDVGPKTDLLSTLALLAANYALVIVMPSTPDSSLTDVIQRLNALREEAGQGPEILGVVATQVDSREGLTRQLIGRMSGAGFTDIPLIPRAIAVARATREGRTIFETEPDNPGAVAYRELASWLDQKLKGLPA